MGVKGENLNTQHVLDQEIYQVKTFWQYSVYRAYLRLKLRHKNTRLGLLWEPLVLILVSFVLALVWSKIFGVRKFEEFFVYVISGLAIWTTISSVVSNGINFLKNNSNSLINGKSPILTYILTDICYEIFCLLIRLPAVVLVVLIYNQSLPIVSPIILLISMLCIIFSGIGFALSIGVLAGLLGDFRMLVSTFMRFAFLVTPIIWMPERLGEYKNYVYLNPFHSYVSVFRSGFMENDEINIDLLISVGCTVFLVIAGLLTIVFKARELRRKAFVI